MKKSRALLNYMYRLRMRLDRPARKPTLEECRWTLRGEVRTRETFGQPHPDDFPGGLPLPPEYPS